MLSEKQIESAFEKIRQRIDKVNGEYLKKVGEQIKTIGRLNPQSVNRIEQMRIYGAQSRKIKKELEKALGLSAKEVSALLKMAAEEEYASADFLAVQTGKKPLPLFQNHSLMTYIEAVSAQTEETFINYSKTTNIDENYRETVSDAIDAVSRGVGDYNSAIRSSMRKLGGDGLRVTYESGHTRRLDTAIRMNILDGVKQIAGEAQRQIGEQIGADGVELSAHPYSAADHEAAQGRQYTLEEYEKMQSGSSFSDTDGNRYEGFRRPVMQWNCRHFPSYILIGISPRRYSDEQLKKWRESNRKGCEIDGKPYTIYEASQLMRRLETKIRQQKDIANLAKISGDGVLRRQAQTKIREIRAKYNETAEKAGLRVRNDKMIVESYAETKAEAEIADKGALSIQKARDAIRNGEYPLNINPEKQKRHMEGTSTKGRSVITVSMEELQEIVNRTAGSGVMSSNAKGEWDKKEIIHAGTVLGYTINEENVIIYTERGKIHYSKTGVHVVPYSGR